MPSIFIEENISLYISSFSLLSFPKCYSNVIIAVHTFQSGTAGFLAEPTAAPDNTIWNLIENL